MSEITAAPQPGYTVAGEWHSGSAGSPVAAAAPGSDA